jgi:NADPH-dependent 2,4-dienoyl-CoA reductase/sulfur reductase-like enzyme/ferredoxin
MAAVPVRIGPPPADGAARPFPPYTELPRRVPRAAWRYVRLATVAGYAALVVTLFADPADGLFALWNVIIPLLPALFFVAPGVWRNLCPLAAANQTPRVLGFTRGLKAPRWLAERGHFVAITGFVVAVGLRRTVLNTHGWVTACALIGIITTALVAGLAYRGKSGWCSSICPLLPVQRLYGQTPFVTSPNSHCEPCVGCTKNCYDFNPAVAFQADMTDTDPDWGASRRVFAGLFPGLVLGYFLLPAPSALGIGTFYLQLAGCAAASAGTYFVVQAVARCTWVEVSALWGATAFASFYWFASVLLAGDLTRWTGTGLAWLRWPIRAAALVLALVWLARTLRVQERLAALAASAAKLRMHDDQLRGLQGETGRSGTPHVVVEPDGRELVTHPGTSVLDAVEAAGLPLEAGCRMGVCGADPIAVRAGADNLAPMTPDEATTLRRLCLPEGNRLACQAIVLGDCTVRLTPDRTAPGSQPPAAVSGSGPDLGRVLVIGGGISGVTVAEKLRAASADTAIALVHREPTHLYNRMGISRMIYGRSAMAGLYLLPEDWFEAQRIDAWLNTVVRSVDLAARTATLATGDVLEWDRLVFANGSRPVEPPITGLGLRGSFPLREAGDAEGIRAYAQRVSATTAVIIGGGLLGLEAAYALHKFGMRVTVLERGPRLLAKAVDERASTLLHHYLSAHGVDVRPQAVAAAVTGDAEVRAVELTDGTALPCDLVLYTIGVQPNAEVAAEAGLAVARGIVVDDHMRASAPDVYACGDVAELDGRCWGLWPTALRQAEIAAANLLGGDERFTALDPPLVLKGVGVALTSVGRLDAAPGEEVLVADDPHQSTYARLVVADGRLVGGLLYGHTREVPHLQRLVAEQAEVGWMLARLRSGDLSVLTEQAPAEDREPLRA